MPSAILAVLMMDWEFEEAGESFQEALTESDKDIVSLCNGTGLLSMILSSIHSDHIVQPVGTSLQLIHHAVGHDRQGKRNMFINIWIPKQYQAMLSQAIAIHLARSIHQTWLDSSAPARIGPRRLRFWFKFQSNAIFVDQKQPVHK
ncbi:uncharacterized protein MYCFIDRAFT_207799 [Pseudocercospora fijiensis CIRAD86]|uniref:Uncharacterized protein n=1 Tax=Pseudocercospora fijiensis (strain CIRAD86) TaxID=383855 RepID=M3B241_PSEFD|nr:uncharacterized protein MYCFIDRAFT_207799 [Pseudocercospora fijiensis CIRAD86]EME83438.1 hypothetical protein MYCFIDRAFT_207799 [Pseudocercospora fijiensis CIRAD86]